MAKLAHIGIAVAELPRLKRLFELLGLEIESEEWVQDQGVRAHFLPFGEPSSTVQGHIELLETVDPNGPVARSIQKRGAGVHHLAFEVGKGELESLCERLKGEGFQLIYDAPRQGAHGMKINFIHPQSAGGVLIEVMERD